MGGFPPFFSVQHAQNEPRGRPPFLCCYVFNHFRRKYVARRRSSRSSRALRGCSRCREFLRMFRGIFPLSKSRSGGKQPGKGTTSQLIKDGVCRRGEGPPGQRGRGGLRGRGGARGGAPPSEGGLAWKEKTESEAQGKRNVHPPLDPSSPPRARSGRDGRALWTLPPALGARRHGGFLIPKPRPVG